MGPNVRHIPGEYWNYWDHNIPISDDSLVEILRYLDFDIAYRVARFLPYSMDDRYPKSPALVALYLRLPLVWPLIGKQFLIHGRK
jgi:hypothetical protein